MRTCFIYVLLCAASLGYAQIEDEILTYEEFITLVENEHPLAKQANMQNQLAEAEILKARGGFDPKIDANHSQKQYKETQYYHLLQSQIKVPTKFGVEFKADYESNEGTFLNPEASTDNLGLWSFGLEANVLRGLFYDRNRASLDLANLMNDVTANERLLILNQLYLDASIHYFNWVNVEAQKEIIQQSIDLAEEYVEITTATFELGDKPAIDTVEARTILLDRQNRLQANEIELIKARQMVNAFLWMNLQPMMMNENVRPEQVEAVEQDIRNLEEVLENHPELVKKRLKLSQYDIEQRMNRENLKPDLSVRFNPIVRGTEDFFIPQEYTPADFKFGAKFAMPLFWRKQRGEVQKTQFKIDNITFELENKRNELLNKIIAEENKLQILTDQQQIYRDNLVNYEKLLEAEQIRNQYGETSLFLLNKREEKVLESRIKIQEIENKIRQTELKIKYLRNGFVTN